MPCVAARIRHDADTILSADNADFLDHAFARSMGVHRLKSGKPFWPGELPDLIAAETHRLWKAQGEQA